MLVTVDPTNIMRNNEVLAILISLLYLGLAAASFPKIGVGLRRAGLASSESEFHTQSCSLTSRRGDRTPIKTMSASQMNTLNLLSGGVAGTISSCVTNPLDVIKTQLQSSARGNPIAIAKKVMTTDGIPGFFRGLPPTLVGIIPARSIYFYSYQKSKTFLGPYLSEGSTGNALLSGFFAGIASNTVTNPIWMVRTRMQLIADAAVGQRIYKGYGDVIATIFKHEGIGGFYKGIAASYWGCTEGALQFLVYEQLKTRLLRRENHARHVQGLESTQQLSKVKYFFSAALAKGMASILTYPHEVARTRMREQALSGVFKYKGMWQSLGVIAREEGRSGLYSGMGVHLLKVVPNSALMFLTYEIVNHWLEGFTVVD